VVVLTVELTFHGAAGGVTGSCYRLDTGEHTVLIDCGLFQGNKSIRELNYGQFPFNARDVDAVLLTHAHVDHAGLFPKLCRAGFKGRAYATPSTIELLGFVLPDSGHIQELEVARLNQRNARRGRETVTPIYTRDDAERALKRLQAVDYEKWFEVVPGVRARFWDAGHILGSASIEISVAQKSGRSMRLLFSGDIGRGQLPFHPDPDAPQGFDYVVMESTYGDRLHNGGDAVARRNQLAAIIQEGLARGGNILIPAFAVERTQELLYDLDVLFDDKVIPTLNVFLDSPLAIHVTDVFDRHLVEINEPGTPHPFRRPNLHFLDSAQDSKKLRNLAGGAIIMAGSGMCDAGRIRHHLRNNLWRPDATVILVGYQAPGTLGRLLEEGRDVVRIQGDDVAVRAKIVKLEGYSGHADRVGLVNWLMDRLPVCGNIFLTHGENDARAGLKAALLATGRNLPEISVPALDAKVRLKCGKCCDWLESPSRATPAMTAPLDWHNDYAQAMIDISRTLQKLPNDAARQDFLAGIRQLITKHNPNGS
jgi:metallo-beta-lactamase family protein